MQRYLSFGSYMRTQFGTKVYKVNVDAGFTCPNRDGTLGLEGCIYCNNDSFRPGPCRPILPVAEQVRNGIAYVRRRYGASRFLVYFQPYTNTYAPIDELSRLYDEALRVDPAIVGLAIGTRPDAIDAEKIRLLEDLARRHFILVEYGLQSIYSRSLEYIRRGHDYAAFRQAVGMTQDRGIRIGCHLIAGFPTETREETLAMAEEISLLEPICFLKMHQLQIVKDTPLAEIFRNAPFPVFGYEEYLDFIVDFIERTSPRIVFQRLFATAPDEILIAPLWGRSRHQITLDIDKRLASRDTWQGKKYSAAPAARQ